MAEQSCAVPMPRHAALCPRCAGPCYAIAVRTHATPSLCVASPLQSRAMLRPCASVLGRSVARRSHALEASPLPCAALPCHGCATRISAHAEHVRADQRPRHESQTRAVPVRCVSSLCPCLADRCFAIARPSLLRLCTAMLCRRVAQPLLAGLCPCAAGKGSAAARAVLRSAAALRAVRVPCRCAACRCYAVAQRVDARPSQIDARPTP